MGARMQLRLASADQDRLDAATITARTDAWADRLVERDTSLWSTDDAVQAGIADRLGWLDAPGDFAIQAPELQAFGDAIRDAGFTTAVVMGMGGSSLAPDVLRKVFGTADGYLQLRILDSTDPAAVAATVDDLDPLQTLWIVASKSGTTTEPLAFQDDAWHRVEAALERAGSDQRPGEFFVAITDPGKSVEAIPHHDELRERFLNPPDIGGRYSALTCVGLVPASLIGLDLAALLGAGTAMLDGCRDPEPTKNPGLQLGLALGTLAKNGRDKLTLLTGDSIRSFGGWLEQLLAESTGKHGVGIVPVDLEPERGAGDYGPDRVFASIRVAGSAPLGLLDEVARLGHPVIDIEIDDPIDLAGEMVRWEVATAFAGAVLGIDAFDQPNVEEAKELTRRVLAAAGKGGDGSADAASDPAPALDVALLGEEGLTNALRRTFRGTEPPRYIAIQAFIAPTPARDAAISRVREALAATGCATTAGYGPRFLHSTGQLHKGGPPTGVFLQLTSDHATDRPIPGWPYTFGQLIDAQARGDREAIAAHDRPIAHVHLGADVDADLAILERAMARALA
jgi:transaldolase/glucose-6-phosphate isomerase